MVPAVFEPRLERQLASNIDEAQNLVWSFLFDLRHKKEGAGRREITEADIRRIRSLR